MFTTKKRILMALWRIEEQQQEILARLERIKAPEKKDYPSVTCGDSSPDKGSRDQWIQEGIDNIMSFQAGGKRSKSE